MRRMINGHWLTANWPLLRNFLLLFLVMLLLVLSIAAIILRESESQLQDALASANLYALERIRGTVDMILKEGERIAYFVSSDENIRNLTEYGSFQYDQYKKVQNLTQALRTIDLLTATTQYVESIYIYYKDSDYLLVSDFGGMRRENFWDTDWIDDARFALTGTQRACGIRRPGLSWTLNTFQHAKMPLYYLTIAQGLSSEAGREGVVLVNLHMESLGGKLDTNMSEDALWLYITDGNDNILYARDSGAVGGPLASACAFDTGAALKASGLRLDLMGQACLVCAVPSEYNDYHFYTISSMESIVRKSSGIRSFSLTVIFVGAALLMVMSFVLAYRFYRPIRAIMSALAAPDDWMERERKLRHSPEDQLCDQILFSVSRNEKLEKELSERMLSLRSAQEAALQSQFNPHFLYNTLDAIHWTCVRQAGGMNPASEMAVLLSDLLRASLDNPEKLIPLGQEMALARKYMRINEIRKPHRCEAIWRIDPALEEMLVARMTLQPILENAWLHGFKGMPSGCQLKISADREEGWMRVRVRDNGCGIAPEPLAALRQSLMADAVSPSPHLGLRNVHQRLRLMFGEPYGLEIDSAPGEGTTVSMRTPLMEREEEP